jgi:signal recognition particle subunit SRP68
MSRAYLFLKRYAEAVSLTQTSQTRLREARYQLSLLSSPSITPETQYLPLSESDLSELEKAIGEEETKYKMEWFTHNGGSVKPDAKDHHKPLFYDIAFNLLEEPFEKIQEKAGRKVEPKKSVAIATHPAAKAKVDEGPAVQEASPESAKPSVMGGWLGGWWGRK